MRNLISINDLTREDIETILFRTPFVDAKDTTAVLFFSEPSTRTRVSFEFAAKQLGMNTIVIEPNHSSMVKGETMADTFETLAQYHPHVVIIRHKMGTACQLAESFFPRSTSIISAGTGTTNHPTQALGDLSLILNKINDYEIKDPVIGIVGDVVHSRVASSLIQIANKMDIKVKLFGPPEFLPSHGLNDQYEKYDSLDDLDHTVDFVYVLRPQRERFEADMFDEEWYRTNWCVHPRHINVHQFVMHAGPVNRGLELAPETMELNNCLINDQVREGLYVRQDILQWIFFDRTVKIDP